MTKFQVYKIYGPFLFCVFLSLMVLANKSPGVGTELHIFFCFLPMVAFGLCAQVHGLKKELFALKKQLDEQENSKAKMIEETSVPSKETNPVRGSFDIHTLTKKPIEKDDEISGGPTHGKEVW